MRVDRDTTYIFDPFNKYGIIKKPASKMFRGDFTLALALKPEYNLVENELKSELLETPETAYNNGCITGLNGKHLGVFLASYFGNDNNINHDIKFEWWEKTDEGDIPKNISININHILNERLLIQVSRYDGEYTLTVNGHSKKAEHGELADYSVSWCWLGAANKLNVGKEDYDEKFASIFTGDLFRYHYQEAPLDEEDLDDIYNAYEYFKINSLKNREKQNIYISTDFKTSTPYKIRDYSDNGNHFIKLDKNWFY